MKSIRLPSTALILAAGRGERLRPLTSQYPKPLLDTGYGPILLKALEHLEGFGVRRVILNTHHAAEAFTRYFPEKRWKGVQLIFRHEPLLLDTAGAVANIRDLWPEGEDLMIWNGDVEASFDLEAAYQQHLEHPESVSTLLLMPDPSGNVLLNPEGRIEDLRGILKPGEPPGHRYSGIGILGREILQRIPLEGPSSLVDIWIEMIREHPGSVRGIVPESFAWREIGTVSALLKVRAERLSGAQGPVPSKEVLRDETAQVLGKSPGVVGFTPLPGGGSTRSYLRVLMAGSPAGIVLCQYDPAFPENRGFCPLAREWAAHGLPVPEIVAERECLYWMTDLGDLSLESYLQENKSDSSRGQELFHEIGRSLRMLHGHFPEDPEMLQESFGPNLFAWEHRYFIEHCLWQVFGISPDDPLVGSVRAELDSVAARLDSLPKVLIHRDFQSRNMILSKKKPTWIDFQGARFGPAVYDLGSFLYDPYIELDASSRQAFLDGYGYGNQPWDMENLHLAAIQRLAQALGAYGNLSLNRGKPEFLPFIGIGLDRLALLLEEGGALGELAALRQLVFLLQRDWPAGRMRSNRVEKSVLHPES